MAAAALSVAAAGITTTGGSAEVVRAWSGGSSAEEKKRLAGSLVVLKDGGYGYFPVSPGAVLFKNFVRLGRVDGDQGEALEDRGGVWKLLQCY